MSADKSELSPARHQDILHKKILTSHDFTVSTSQQKPKAIILAGQPGAGKGNLRTRAEFEFDNDNVSVDPDELRQFHPDVQSLQKEHPYNWSGYTQTDAREWSQEKCAAAIEQRKNLVIDTTLGSGERAVELAKTLQKNGYEVEVHAMATSYLESELGVDQRFTRSFDKNGYGRYVPQEARKKIYDALPGNLDHVHQKTGVPIKIYNREGRELYDSSKSGAQLSPGAALQKERKARMQDPAIACDVWEGWKKQLEWHQNLEHVRPHDAATHANMLAERKELGVVEGVSSRAKEAEHAHFQAETKAKVKSLAQDPQFERGTGAGGRVGQTEGMDVYMSSKRDALYGRDGKTGKLRHLAGDPSFTDREAKRWQRSGQKRDPDLEMG